MNDFLENFNDLSTEKTFVSTEVEKNKPLAIIAYILPFLFFLPILSDKDSDYCKFHSNQSLTWLIFLVVVAIVMKILGLIPVLGALCNLVLSLALLAMLIIYIIGVVNSKAYRLPIIGNLINVF